MKSQFGSGLWPVVQRELRAAARWPLGPWLRMGGALVGVFTLFSLTTAMPASVLGAQLFSRIHLLLLCMICGLVPALTADCIARERRESTLGLLFMTPLSASGIVLGKSLAQTLRAVTLWLAVLPLLTIPFLYGGVTWADVAGFFTIELCAGMICLAAGVLASSLTDNRAIAFILAFLFMGAFVAWSLQYQDLRMGNLTPMQMAGTASMATIQNGIVVIRAGPGEGLMGLIGVSQYRIPARILAENFIFAAAILFAALRFAGFCVTHSWQDRHLSIRRQNWVKRYCTPVFKRWFVHNMRRALERNPIAWLQQYSWKARLTKWGLCLLVLLMECAVLEGNKYHEGMSQVLTNLLLILAAAYTFAGVNGFFQEKKNGALELIVVSTLSINQIIFGRVWGLWKQFLSATILLVVSDIVIRVTVPNYNLFVPNYDLFYGSPFSWERGWDSSWMIDLEIVGIYLTLPIVATCFALTTKNLLVVSILTVTMVFGPTAVLFYHDYIIQSLFSSAPNGSIMFRLRVLLGVLPFPPLPICVMVAHACSVFFSYTRLRRSLTRRSYAF